MEVISKSLKSMVAGAIQQMIPETGGSPYMYVDHEKPAKVSRSRPSYYIDTDAEALISNNFNITFSNPEPPREGLKRAMLRLRDIQINNREIPVWKNESRQVRRAKERAADKIERSRHRHVKNVSIG